MYSYFTSSTPTPTLELGELPSDKKIKSAQENLELFNQSKDVDTAFADWIKEVKAETIGLAHYYSKPIKQSDLNKTETELNLLTLKPSLWLDANEYNRLPEPGVIGVEIRTMRKDMPLPSRRLIKIAGYRWSGITPIRMIIINLRKSKISEPFSG